MPDSSASLGPSHGPVRRAEVQAEEEGPAVLGAGVGSQLVDAWRAVVAAVAGEVGVAEVVGQDEEDVRAGGRGDQQR